ncbi:MAG: pyridoxine 5'-phosphate synthase [Pseudomonadota bacterium]
MTALSVNINKLALLRNSRGRDYPNLLSFAARFIELGVQGITIHPRPDERHIRRADAYELGDFLRKMDNVEFNIEGFPSIEFLKLIKEIRPHQCTLVPDADNQLTSDHGWDFKTRGKFLADVIGQIKSWGVRAAVFLDPDESQVELAAQAGADRIELYTAHYAQAYAKGEDNLAEYRSAALRAQSLQMGVNAGHDLDLQNLKSFLTIPKILEVSIGHALIVECIEQGMDDVIASYLAICRV